MTERREYGPSTARFSIFGVHSTLFHIPPQAMRTHSKATGPLRISYEDPDTSSIVNAKSQQKRELLHFGASIFTEHRNMYDKTVL